MALPPDVARRLGALGVQVTEDAERLRERLRLTNAEYERMMLMADGWRRISVATGEPEARAMLYRLGAEKYLDRVLLAWSRAREEGTADKAWRALATLPQRWTAPMFPLKAADFTARGVPKGPALGLALRAAEEAWVAAGFPMDEAALQKVVDAAARG